MSRRAGTAEDPRPADPSPDGGAGPASTPRATLPGTASAGLERHISAASGSCAACGQQRPRETVRLAAFTLEAVAGR